MIWVTADPHYGHVNLVRGISNWSDKSGCRPFDTMEEHNQTIIDGINDNVAEDDTLYVLGDWNFGGVGNIWRFRKQLNVKDIRFLLGNHDKQLRENKVIEIPLDDLNRYKEIFEVNAAAWRDKFYIYCQDLFTWVEEYHQTTIDGTLVNMFHYSCRVWDRSHHGSYMLHGHSHNSLPDYGRSLDVGLESAYELLGEWRPFHWDEIDEILSKRPIQMPDHHNEQTTQ